MPHGQPHRHGGFLQQQPDRVHVDVKPAAGLRAHLTVFKKVCGPKRAGARVQTPEMRVDWYSPITKLRRQRSAFKDLLRVNGRVKGGRAVDRSVQGAAIAKQSRA
jgi:hypothetical protein